MRLTLVLVVGLVGCAEIDDNLSQQEQEVSSERAQLVASTRASIAFRGVTAVPDAPRVRKKLVRLGRLLAHDKILSGDRDVSCMTCHPGAAGTDDDRHLSLGVESSGVGIERTGNFAAGEEGRNSPPLFNMHAMQTLFWDGRVEQLPNGDFRTPAGNQFTPEMKAVAEFGAISVLPLFPVTARDEMRGFNPTNELAAVADGNFTEIWKRLMTRLGSYPEYRKLFEEAYPGTKFKDMTFAHAANAIAGFFVAKFEANDSDWDRFLRGNDKALKLEALRGAEVFMRTCVNCHGGSTGSDQRFHNTALAQFGPGPRSGGGGPSGKDDFGRERVTGVIGERYAFRTTPLRNVEHTGPYGHTGEIVDLRDFVDHYSVHLDSSGQTIGTPAGPAQNLREWDRIQIDDRLQLTVLDNTPEILGHIDPLFANGSPIRPEFVDPITEFMLANTDESSIRRARKVAPRHVPSGLSVSSNEYADDDCDD